ncbi:MAG: CPBP family intramembrane metalloprotease [Bacteroidetes bacterium]|nr:CPBP family intramembrane metalloprotease [Bacteroidota bacterium]
MNVSELLFEYWYFVVLYEVLCAGFASFLARSKGRDQGIWFVWGLVLGVVGLVLILAMKKLPEEIAAKNNLLLDSENFLRSGWRALLFLVTVIVLYYLSAVLSELTRVVPPQSLFFLFYIDVALATFLMLKFIDKRRFTSVGVPYHGKVLKEVLLGVLIGTVMIGAVGGFELLIGAVKLNVRQGLSLTLLLRNFGLSFLFFAYFAAGEELLFRGYSYQTLIEGMGGIGATIFMAAVFGAMHVFNPNAGLISMANTMLAGAWLSVAYLKKRTLYFPFGMHFSWNFVQSFILSLPVSGLLTNRTIFVPTDFGPDWLTGGRYGPEAGVGTTVVLIAALLYFLLDRRIKPAYDYAAYKNRL